MLCKTKGHVKADVALFKSLQGHEEKKETKVISGLISRPKNLLPQNAVGKVMQRDKTEDYAELHGLITIRSLSTARLQVS